MEPPSPPSSEPQNQPDTPVPANTPLTLISNNPHQLSIALILTVLVFVAAVLTVIYFLTSRSQSLMKFLFVKPLAPTPTQSPTNLITTGGLSQGMPKFASYKEDATTVTASIPSYTLSTNDLSNLTQVQSSTKKTFSQSQLDALHDTGFFLTPADNLLVNGDREIDFRHQGLVDEFLYDYKDIFGRSAPEVRRPENAVFITSDFLLHAFHVYLDRTFQNIEETQFQPKLLALSSALFSQSLSQYQKADRPEEKQSLARLSAFFLIPKVILETANSPRDSQLSPDNETVYNSAFTADKTADSPEKILADLSKYKDDTPKEIYDLVKQEIKLINDATGIVASPIFGQFKPGQPDDYTQFNPRSHYQKASRLRAYWKAMIWYGRTGFLVKSNELSLDAINQSLLLASTKVGDQTALSAWEQIYLPTVFFVGKSDDLTFYDYLKIIDKVYGKDFNFNTIPDKTKRSQFQAEVKSLPGPLIQSSIVAVGPNTTKEEALAETKSFRFMGQRFIPDSFIFSSLTQGDEAPDPETGQTLPPVPTALMPISILGSATADAYLTEWIKTNAPNSDKVIAKNKSKITADFVKLSTADWTANIYWSWLYTLKTLFTKFSSGYPMFMQSSAWNNKGLNAALGSWTELRHDTLLYGKQSYAELGGGPGEQPTPPPVPKGYIEPNLLFINRLIALARMTKEGLTNNHVMPDEQAPKLDGLINAFTFYRDLAVKELKNENISDADFEKLRVQTFYEINSDLTPPSASIMQASEARAGLIADVHTAVTQTTQKILYEATGIPNIIYVAVKDANGTRLARGVVYSQYEFTQPFGKRLSDSDWQAQIYEGKKNFTPPQDPAWVTAIKK